MDYTMEDVDAALVEILGKSTFDLLCKPDYFNRPAAMDRAAVKCFLNQRTEDRHVAVLRASLGNLNRTGIILKQTRATPSP